MPYGIPVPTTDTYSNEKARKIINKVKRIVNKYGLDDASWAEAISSQYFLLCIAKQLHLERQDYFNLINKCLEPVRVTYSFDLVLDDNKIQITQDETKRITDCMIEEDKKDAYYSRISHMKATNIDPQLMYRNFHNGLLVRNAATMDTEVLKKVKHFCLDKLLSEKALDYSGGWYPFRVPWITGRILISLKAIDTSEYPQVKKLSSTIESAIDSLYERINEEDPYWRSGVGDWVTKWESTALCLEALLVWNSIAKHKRDVKKIIDYICNEKQEEEWLNIKIDFSEEKAANHVLAGVTLGSVVYRITTKYYPGEYDETNEKIECFLHDVVEKISKQGTMNVQQYCTLPQILYYVVETFQPTVEEEDS